jgi:hypothetical protein
VFAPDGSGKLGGKNYFSRSKRATAGSSFYDFRKKGFEGGLATYSWNRLYLLFLRIDIKSS